MTIIYVATSANRLKAIEVDNDTGGFVRTVQEIDPIVPPHTGTIPTTLTDGDIENSNNTATTRKIPSSRIDASDNNNDDDGKDGKNSLGWEWFTSHLSLGKPTTEWIERHPTFESLLYVFTSFGNTTSAVVTTYRILGVGNSGGGNADVYVDVDLESIRGRLKKLGSVETKGLQVSHVTFSPDYSNANTEVNHPSKSKPPSTLCVGHYLDGNLSFFDCSRDGALDEPQRVVGLPEVRPETRETSFPNPLPSIHHVTYNPRLAITKNDNGSSKNRTDEDDDDDDLCNYLLVSDTSKQARVWTFEVDSLGLPVSSRPVSFHKVTYITPPSGWLTRILTGSWVVGLADYRIRRCVVHPNRRYVYLLLEFNTVIQVYEIHPVTGRISGDCLQEVPAIDPDYFAGWKKATGAAIHASAELCVTETDVFVSTRGTGILSKGNNLAESGVRIFSIENNGAKLVPKQYLPCGGPVRHFVALSSDGCLASSSPQSSVVRLFAGSDKGRQTSAPQLNSAGGSTGNGNGNSASIETFVQSDLEDADGIFERVGVANVGMDDITCIAVLP